MNIQKIDLNLLVVLNALLDERSVSRVARRLHLSQPAVSHALARARIALEDPLLIRDGGSMVPTPQAMRLQAGLREVLASMEELLGRMRPLEPARLTEVVHLGMTDYADFLLMPSIVERLRAQAPGVRLIARDVSSDLLAQDLFSGRIDMAVAPSVEVAPNLHQELLYEERYVCLAAQDFRGRLTLKRYLQSQHVQVSYRGVLAGGPDDGLLRMGLSRNVVLSTPHFMAAAGAVARAGLLMTTMERLAWRLVREHLPLRILDVPFELPKIELELAWPSRTHLDSAQAWMRSVIRDVAEAALR